MQNQHKANVRDYITDETIKALQYPPEICENIIGWVYKDAIEQTKNVRSIELSGFGTLHVAPAKLRRRLKEWQKKVENYTQTCEHFPSEHADKQLHIAKQMLEFLNSKKEDENSVKGHMGRLEESSISSEGYESSYRANIPGTPGHMQNM